MFLRFLNKMSAMAHHLTLHPLHQLLLFSVLFVPPGVAFAQRSSADAPRGAGLFDDDSLELRDIELDLEKSRLRLNATSFFRRLLGTVQLTVSMGWRDLLFVDRSTTLPYAFPNDAYRATVSLSPDLFFREDHALAQCDFSKIELLRDQIRLRQSEFHNELLRKDTLLSELRTYLLEELRIRRDLATFNDLRFQQGKIKYDLLMRSKLDVIAGRRTLTQLDADISAVRSKLGKHAIR